MSDESPNPGGGVVAEAENPVMNEDPPAEAQEAPAEKPAPAEEAGSNPIRLPAPGTCSGQTPAFRRRLRSGQPSLRRLPRQPRDEEGRDRRRQRRPRLRWGGPGRNGCPSRREIAAMNKRENDADAAVVRAQDALRDAQVDDKEAARALYNVLGGYIGEGSG